MVADSPGIQQHILDEYQKASTFIPYGAELFSQPDISLLNQFQLQPYQYYLSVSRLEPENNLEMIMEGYSNSKRDHDLIIVAGINKFGKRWKEKYSDNKIRFVGPVFNKTILSNLRYFSKLHFHGHSVGGTNPSLLEAMACQSNIAAHNNIFNKAILGNEAEYFSNSEEISAILNSEIYTTNSIARKEENLKKISQIYNWQKIVDAYEDLMFESIHTKSMKNASEQHQIVQTHL
jgi:glycosyltransferase involved in cell wall biosynthesis